MSSPGSTDELRPPSKELRRLVDGLLAESLTRVEFTQLEELLENDPDALRYYLEISANEALIGHVAEDLDLAAQPPEKRSPKITRFVSGGAAVAALIVAFIAGVFQHSPDEEDPGISATSGITGFTMDDSVWISGGVGVEWASGHPATSLPFGSPLPSEEVSIESGLLELTYANGVSVLLEGPPRYHITGLNSGTLIYGNLVAEVPKSVEGFSVDFAEDRLVDQDTQFGVRLPKDTQIPEVAVFRGEVEIFPGKKEFSTLLTRDHAVRRISNKTGVLVSIPLDRSIYARELPSREIAWKMPAVSLGELSELQFDVSNLIRKPGDYLFIFKWMQGQDALQIKNVELYLDGTLINSDSHTGTTGIFPLAEKNSYSISISSAQFRPGKWTLKAQGRCPNVEDTQRASDCQGILLVEEGGLVGIAELEDCIGHWDYWHDGQLWSRHVHEQGSFSIYREGKFQTRGLWEARDGGLLMFFPREKIYERHILRDANTLLFIDQPYRNALRR